MSEFAATRVLSAQEYDRLVAADQDRRKTGGRLEALPSLHEEVRLHGYQEGIRNAVADIADTMREMYAYREDRSAWIRVYVLAVLRKMLGGTGAAALVQAIAERAVEQCDRNLETLRVHVCPDVFEQVQSALGEVARKRTSTGPHIHVVPDSSLDLTECEVHTPFGIIDAGLETQLKALELALGGGDAPRN